MIRPLLNKVVQSKKYIDVIIIHVSRGDVYVQLTALECIQAYKYMATFGIDSSSDEIM